MKTRKILLITFVMLIGLGGYFANKTVANSTEVESSAITLDGTYGYDDTSAWCDPSDDKCATISVQADKIVINPEFAPGEYDSKQSSYEITEEQLSTLQSGGAIALPSV